MHLTGNFSSCMFLSHVFGLQSVWPWKGRSYLFLGRLLLSAEKTFCSNFRTRNHLTHLRNQFHLKTVSSLPTAITAHVRVFQLIDPDGVVPLYGLVWKGFHAATSGLQELYTAFRCELYQLNHINVEPRCGPVGATCWKDAWQDHGGAGGNVEFLRCTECQILCTRIPFVLLEIEKSRNNDQAEVINLKQPRAPTVETLLPKC